MKTRLTILMFMTLLTFNLKAQQINLDTLVNMDFENIPLKEVLQEIAQKQGIRFSYSDSKLPMDRLITCSYHESTLNDFLNDFFHRNEINFNIIENQIVLYPFNANETIKIKGKIVDQSDGTPVPYANISLSGTYKGTSSNEDGEFEIELTKLPSELVISHLSHDKKMIYVYDDAKELVINLLPSQTLLQGITIKAKGRKFSSYQLVKRAYDQLGKASNDMFYGKAFYRQKSKREDKFTEIFELFYDIKYSANGIEDWAVQEGRYAFQNDSEYDIFLYNKNFTLLSRMFPIRQPETTSYIIPVNQDVKKLFDLTLKEIIKFDERYIAIISFTPKPTVNLPTASGELYLDIDNYEILKMKGTISDPTLAIIGFNDNSSSWNNYRLDFQISFIEDHETGKLLMDYIQIDHTFDYYFNNISIGKINTSSILTFYEHYTPIKNKRLGGAINYETSDMDVIDHIGYDPIFWHQNPIVRRTPLEEKLIRDFEQNEAFGVVFMNNEDEVVLLPDKKNSEKAKQIIAIYESDLSKEANQVLFLRLDKDVYSPGEFINFTAYVLDRWTYKPSGLGSVLTLEMYDNENNIIASRKFDIDQGHSYGEMEITLPMVPGVYILISYTNIPGNTPFIKTIGIGYQGRNDLQKAVTSSDQSNLDLKVDFYPESGTFLQGVKNKIVFRAETSEGYPVVSQWNVVDDAGNIIQTTSTDKQGIGTIEITPLKDRPYFLKNSDSETDKSWELPEVKSNGFSMNIDSNRDKSLKINLNQSPTLPREIYLLSTAHGKAFSFYEKRLSGQSTVVDLPTQHLPAGVNTLVAMDPTGKIVAQRAFFIRPPKLSIQLESASFKSKRNNIAELKFRVTDQNGSPAKAHLSAISSIDNPSGCSLCDIRQYVFFQGNRLPYEIKFDLDNDSIFTLIDQLLITSELNKSNEGPFVSRSEEDNEKLANKPDQDEATNPVFAEVNISGNYSSGTGTADNKIPRQVKKHEIENKSYWIPFLEIDDQGVSIIDYKVENKNEMIYLNIQGLSDNGQVGYQDFMIDPRSIEIKKNSK